MDRSIDPDQLGLDMACGEFYEGSTSSRFYSVASKKPNSTIFKSVA